ncbi:MAG: hypothetical protein UR96_C0004G0014 [candidate division WS6 bacterium GW2011_GWC1_36_11]|uniref:Uncharacterized protein n=3 Tax=Candidatus Dojkabacteria TaxID=74243 RepID=A0A0G0GMJ7_9BACT|nr:MAG: hypothetical protein UR96_C0004G0014 [candidate division WS6 bacterium GW2011_GWC1_36_11]KKQ12207.1 MAG: hypothetical protein US24_C0003G0011 [candidate division WS6 bacterium GW2011_GWC2_36_7]KKQ16842.1 MAG: hypothetical protein US29_C0017G0008 [candidate division WS6 bacterium GW2011_GWF1_36_8]
MYVMVNSAEEILCITNNYAYKEQLRNLFISHSDIAFTFANNISEAEVRLQDKRFSLILIDDSLIQENPYDSEKLFALLVSLCLTQHVLIIIPALEKDLFYKYISRGFTYITNMETARYMLPAVLRHLEEFKLKRPPPENISFKGLSIYPQSSTLIFKKCKISITNIGMLIILFLVKHGGHSSTCAIQKYLQSILRREITESYVSVNIHRLTKSIYKVTGLKIIKNRYGVGYHLVL